jgi:hypothetical protein
MLSLSAVEHLGLGAGDLDNEVRLGVLALLKGVASVEDVVDAADDEVALGLSRGCTGAWDWDEAGIKGAVWRASLVRGSGGDRMILGQESIGDSVTNIGLNGLRGKGKTATLTDEDIDIGCVSGGGESDNGRLGKVHRDWFCYVVGLVVKTCELQRCDEVYKECMLKE